MTTEIHVAIDGDDSYPGNAQEPVATLHGARELVREARQKHPDAGIVVTVHPGTYYLGQPL